MNALFCFYGHDVSRRAREDRRVCRDHGVPHFHIEGPDFRCSVAIASCELIIGHVPTAILEDAVEWARRNQALLMQTWQELNG